VNDIFDRNVPGMTEILKKKTVAIAGCGGLGSNGAVALVRAGLGNIILADYDVVEPSNLNRQYFCLQDIGKKKVEVLATLLKTINPDVHIITHHQIVTAKNVGQLFGNADLLIEGLDRADNKQFLIESWSTLFPRRPLVCGNGLAGIGNIDKVKVTKLNDVIYFCGDGSSDMNMGLCAARVAMVANMQANVAIELLLWGELR
jgi:sulfur carrier protein ThiS adenylyltransferase